jgi:hypothetical protein
MPLAEWPAIDQQRWILARFKGDILEPQGLAAKWSDITVKQDLKAYGLWLQYLKTRGILDAGISPGPRLSKVAINGFAEDLEGRVASTTAASRLSTLSRMIRVLDYDSDRSWLITIGKRYARRARPSRN